MTTNVTILTIIRVSATLLTIIGQLYMTIMTFMTIMTIMAMTIIITMNKSDDCDRMTITDMCLGVDLSSACSSSLATQEGRPQET